MKSVRARHLTVKALGLPAVLLGWIEEIRIVLIEEQLRVVAKPQPVSHGSGQVYGGATLHIPRKSLPRSSESWRRTQTRATDCYLSGEL
jgi:hypothetical protein